MREQIEFSLTEEFHAFTAGLSELEEAQSVIHGVFIDLHPIWKQMVDFVRATGIYVWPRYWEKLSMKLCNSGLSVAA